MRAETWLATIVIMMHTLSNVAFRRNSNYYINNLQAARRQGVVMKARSGGRAPGTPNNINTQEDEVNFFDRPVDPSATTLTLVQITDVYTLENFPSFRTLMRRLKARNPGNTYGLITGDFLAPYLLSTIDKGHGMMRMLNAEDTVDFITWGNHECDIPHEVVCEHVRNSPKAWINSNMCDHDAMEYQHETLTLTVTSKDGSQEPRKVGLCAVLSDDPALYGDIPDPGAFGGATITDPYEALARCKEQLEEEGCDVVIPLQHMYVPQDHRTCQTFDFPVVMSGHDHHRVDEIVDGTRLLKPGLDAIYATVLEMTWDSDAEPRSPPTLVQADFVKVSDIEPDPELMHQVEEAYSVLDPLRNTELLPVPQRFLPLSSFNSRGRVCSMGRFLCTALRNALNTNRGRETAEPIDAVLLMGGNVRGGRDYGGDSADASHGPFFSLEALESEVHGDLAIGVVTMPGWLLSEGVRDTHKGDPIPGWFQYCDGVIEDDDADAIIAVAGEPLDPERMYRIATKVPDLTNGQSKPFTEFYTKHPELLPLKGKYYNAYSELIKMVARNLWRRMWEIVMAQEGDHSAEEAFRALGGQDLEDEISVPMIHHMLRELLGLSIDETDTEMTLAMYIHDFADRTGDGLVKVQDLEVFLADDQAFAEYEGPVTKRLRK